MWKYWLRERVYVSWHITVVCAGFVVGVAGAQWIVISHPSYVLASALLLFIALARRYRYLLIVALVAGLLLGLVRGGVTQRDLTKYQPFFGEQITLRGIVPDDADTAANGSVTSQLGEVTIGDNALPGRIWISLANGQDIQRSDILTVSGELSKGFGSFPASMYRAQVERHERPEPGDIALHVRDSFSEHVHTAISSPAADLGVGYLLGQKSALPNDLEEALRIAGLTHVVVASGYNLTILVRLARRLFARISKYMAATASFGLMGAFIAVTGASPSMTRAGIVTGLSLLAWYYGRRFHPLTILTLAAAITVLINPAYAWGDLGWGLSFAAFAGVMILAPLLQRYFFGEKDPGTVRQILGETVSAQVMTAPLILLSFGVISNVAVIANLLILPLVPLAMLLTFFAGVAAYISPFVAHIVGLPAQLLLDYMIGVARYTADIPWAQTEIPIGVIGAVVCYLAITVAIVWMRRATGYRLYQSSIVE